MKLAEINIGKRGYIALFMIAILTGLILIIVMALTNIVISKMRISKNTLYSAQSYYSAESAVEDGLLRVLNGYGYSASNSFTLDGANIICDITQSGETTTIESYSDYSNNQRKVRTSLTITQDDIAFHYGVQVGRGGLTMGNISEIEGNIYSDGTIVGGNLSKIDGDAFVATGMQENGKYDNGGDTDGNFGKVDPVIDVAQSFKPTVSASLSQVSLYIKKNGNPQDKTIRIFTDDGTGGVLSGSPTKTELASDTFDTSKIGSSYGWVDFSFSSPAFLTAGTWYWIVIDTSQDNSKYFTIWKDLNKGNGNGSSKHSSNWEAAIPGWTVDSGDFYFKVWLGGQPTYLDGVIVVNDAHAHDIKNSYVCGDAYYQTIDSSSLDFLNDPTAAKCIEDPLVDPPLSPGTANSGAADPPVEALPISDSNIADWKADALAGNPNLSTSLCTANTDITIDAGVLDCTAAPDGAFAPSGGITITLNGTLWIKGNVIIKNGSSVRLSSGYGSKSGIIIADNPASQSTSGKITIENGVYICGSGGVDTSLPQPVCFPPASSYIMFLSTHNSTTTSAITVSNKADGAIFYAHNGIATVLQNADLKEVTAYKLNLAENAKVTYESGLASASFTSGPGGGWTISGWNEFE